MSFKVSLDNYITKGRVNFALYGNLIQKDSRDAQIIIADNIQHIVFAEMPEFDCMVTLDINVKGRSSTGEESIGHFRSVRSIISRLPYRSRRFIGLLLPALLRPLI